MNQNSINYLEKLLDTNEIRITEFSDCLLSVTKDGEPCSRLKNLHSEKSDTTPSNIKSDNSIDVNISNKKAFDVIIVGTGLSGLTAAISLIDRGAKVLLVEKNAFMGGNSSYASSGINAVNPLSVEGDTVDNYFQDTLKSSNTDKNSETYKLIEILTQNSYEALQWIRNRIQLPFKLKGQLGGHSYPRTYRPESGLAGSKMIYNMSNLVKKIQATTPQLQILLNSVVVELLSEHKNVNGVKILTSDHDLIDYRASVVIMATGGYASDRENDSLLIKYRPELSHLKTTNGEFATGDGHKIVDLLGGSLVDMKNVQVHPTAFIDPKHPDASRKTLCAEILRGVGGILLNKNGERFCNELGRRDATVRKMKETDSDSLNFTILLPEKVINDASKHIPLYLKKGLLTKLSSLQEVANWMHITQSKLLNTLNTYNQVSLQEVDNFGKRDFRNVPFQEGIYYVGTVTPALHYTMGGIHIDAAGRVLNTQGEIIPGLYCIGEATGGVHGINRLGGNALTECVVFGRLVGTQIPLKITQPLHKIIVNSNKTLSNTENIISLSELSKHTTEEDCWVAVHGKVYNLTKFLDEHPPGAQSILDYAGTDATEIFDAAHTIEMLDDFVPVGVLESYYNKMKDTQLTINKISKEDMTQHLEKLIELNNMNNPSFAECLLGLTKNIICPDLQNTLNTNEKKPTIINENQQELHNFIENLLIHNNISIVEFTDCLLKLSKNELCPRVQKKLSEIEKSNNSKKITWADDDKHGKELHETHIIPSVGKARPVPKR